MTSTQPPAFKPIIAFTGLALLSLIWSASFMLIKVSLQTITPFSHVSLRLLIALIVLAFCYILLPKKSGFAFNSNFFFAAIVVGVFGNVLPFSLISFGQTRVDSALAGIMIGIMPIATATLAHLLIPGERLTWIRAVGVCLGFTGLLLLLGYKSVVSAEAELVGLILILGAALCYAITSIYISMYAQQVAILPLAAGSIMVATFIVSLLSLALETPFSLTPSLPSLAATAVLGGIQTGLATVLYLYLLRLVGPTLLSQINNLIPVLAVGWGVFVMHEVVAQSALLALALVLVGIYLVNIRQNEFTTTTPICKL